MVAQWPESAQRERVVVANSCAGVRADARDPSIKLHLKLNCISTRSEVVNGLTSSSETLQNALHFSMMRGSSARKCLPRPLT